MVNTIIKYVRLGIIAGIVAIAISPDYVPDIPKRVGHDLMQQYIMLLASSNPRNTERVKRLYVDAIFTYSEKYGLPVRYVARQLHKESLYDHECDGADGEHGCAQIKTKEHGWIFKTLKNYDPRVPVEEQAHWIYNNIEVQCWLMSNYYTRYKDYEVALICYWRGEFSWQLKGHWRGTWDFKATEYYKCVMQSDYILKKWFAISNTAEWAYSVAQRNRK